MTTKNTSHLSAADVENNGVQSAIVQHQRFGYQCLIKSGIRGSWPANHHWMAVSEGGTRNAYGPPGHRHVVNVTPATRDADAGVVVVDGDYSLQVARCWNVEVAERPLSQRKHGGSRPTLVAPPRRLVAQMGLIFEEEQQVYERPAERLQRYHASVLAWIDFPVVRTVKVAAQEQAVGGFQRRKWSPDQLLVGRVEHQIDVVVPRNSAVMSVRSEQGSAVHEVGDVEPVEYVQYGAQGPVQRAKIILGERWREQFVWVDGRIPMDSDDGARYQESDE